MRRTLAVAVSVVLLGCGGSTLVSPEHGGDGGSHDDGGSPASDSGAPGTDGGVTHHDGGTTCGAAGSSTACMPVTIGTVTAMAGITSIADDDMNVYVADEGGQIQAISVTDGKSTLLGNIGQTNADLALAVSGNDVCFTATNTVGLVPKAGGAIDDLVTNESPEGLAVSGSTLFWSQPFLPGSTGGISGEILSLPITGGTPKVLASKVQIDFGVTTDGVNVYWVGGDGDIDAVPVGGGAVTVLATKQYGAETLASDGVNLYWTSDNAQMGTCGVCPPPPPPTATDSSVYKMPITGGTPTVIATGYRIDIVAVDGTDAYWFDSYKNTLSAVPVAGGDAVVLATGVNSEVGLLADTGSLYWISTEGKLMGLAKK